MSKLSIKTTYFSPSWACCLIRNLKQSLLPWLVFLLTAVVLVIDGSHVAAILLRMDIQLDLPSHVSVA